MERSNTCIQQDKSKISARNKACVKKEPKTTDTDNHISHILTIF